MPQRAPDDHWDRAWRAAAACPDLLSDLKDLYDCLDAELAAAPVTCDRCGRCCNFRQFGHRLYVTPAEGALLLQGPSPNPALVRTGCCPYLCGARCAVRGRRTLGCRVFFCRAGESASAQVYEKYHLRIRELHQTHCVPYAYVEFDQLIQSILC